MRHYDRKWTDNDKNLLRKLNHLKSPELATILDRTVGGINSMRVILGLTKRKSHRVDTWSADEDTKLKELYLEYQDYPDIKSKLDDTFGMKRTIGAIKQKIFQLGLKRDNRRTRLIQRFGVENVPLDKPVEEINAGIKAEQDKLNEAVKQAVFDKINAALDQMIWNLRNHPGTASRKEEYQKAMLAGATLEQIGQRENITRERVRQIIYGIKPYVKKKDQPGYINPLTGVPRKPRKSRVRKVRPPKVWHMEPSTLVCKKCAQEFTYPRRAGTTTRRYCDGCAAILRTEGQLKGLDKMKQRLQAKLDAMKTEDAKAIDGTPLELPAGGWKPTHNEQKVEDLAAKITDENRHPEK